MKDRVIIGLAVLCAGCGTSEGPGPGADVEVVDSLGVTIVTNHEPEYPAGSWRLGELVTSIGAVEGDSTQILGNPVGARKLESGDFAVADQMTNQIRVYDAAGQHVVTRGRAGEGPGEYRYLSSLLPYRGDSLAAVEIGSRRISVLGPDLSFGRVLLPQPTFVFRREGLRPEQSCCWVSGTMDGAFVVEYPGMIPVAGFGARRSSATIVRLAPDGTFLDTLGTFESAEYHPAGAGSRSPVAPSQLSNRVTSVARDSTAYVTDGRTLTVQAIGADGNLRRIIRIARDPEPVTDDLQAVYRSSMEARIDEDMERYPQAAAEFEYAKRSLHETPFHGTVPAINTMLIDGAGNLWVTAVQTYWRGTDTEWWEVFDPGGRWLASVDIPGELRVFDIGEDYVMGMVQDEMDVPFIRVYELVR